MVNIFGMKFFESPSIEEQMHEKSRKGHHYKSRRHSRRPHYKSRRHHFSRRQGLLKGGYVYNGNDKNISKEDDVTMELSDSKQEKSRVGKGTKRRRHQ